MDDDNDDDSVMLVSKKPAARPPPGKKAPFKCVPGEVLRVMQDRLASNASKNNVASSSLGTLKAMFADLVQCRGPLLKIAKELDHRMEIVGEGKPVLIADLLLKAIPFEVTKRTSSTAQRFVPSPGSRSRRFLQDSCLEEVEGDDRAIGRGPHPSQVRRE